MKEEYTKALEAYMKKRIELGRDIKFNELPEHIHTLTEMLEKHKKKEIRHEMNEILRRRFFG